MSIGLCHQCSAVEAIDYCSDCDDNLCSDCRMFDPVWEETVCEACLVNRENES